MILSFCGGKGEERGEGTLSFVNYRSSTYHCQRCLFAMNTASQAHISMSMQRLPSPRWSLGSSPRIAVRSALGHLALQYTVSDVSRQMAILDVSPLLVAAYVANATECDEVAAIPVLEVGSSSF